MSRFRWQNTYNYGDFHGSEEKLLKYYDAYFYIANWGTMLLGLAFPNGCLNPDLLPPYLRGGKRYENSLSVTRVDDRCIVWWSRNDDEGWGWTEGEGIINELVGIREEIMCGDYRALFLGWLADFDPEEWLDSGNTKAKIPPIPSNLGTLSASLSALIEQFPVDSDALAVAVALSQSVSAERTPIATVIDNLSESEMRALLQRVGQGDGAKVMSELNRLTYPTAEKSTIPRMTCTEFAVRALKVREERLKKEAAAAEAERKRKEEERRQHLASVRRRANIIWASLDPLMDQKIASAYDEVAAQLRDLRDAYKQSQETDSFQKRLETFSKRYARRPAMIRRIEEL